METNKLQAAIKKHKLINKVRYMTVDPALGALILRIISIGLYLAAYRNIETITRYFIEFSKSPLLLLLLQSRRKNGFSTKDSLLKSFILIMLIFSTLIPIFKSLVKEIDTDTIFFWFGLCQIIFCVDSVRVSIHRNNRTVQRKEFHRDQVIPLEESVLIPQKNACSGVIGNTAALAGFFTLFSRIDDNTQILVLQATSFVFYLFVPWFLEMNAAIKNAGKLGMIVASLMIFLFLGDFFIFKIIFVLVACVTFLIIGLYALLDNY